MSVQHAAPSPASQCTDTREGIALLAGLRGQSNRPIPESVKLGEIGDVDAAVADCDIDVAWSLSEHLTVHSLIVRRMQDIDGLLYQHGTRLLEVLKHPSLSGVAVSTSLTILACLLRDLESSGLSAVLWNGHNESVILEHILVNLRLLQPKTWSEVIDEDGEMDVEECRAAMNRRAILRDLLHQVLTAMVKCGHPAPWPLCIMLSRSFPDTAAEFIKIDLANARNYSRLGMSIDHYRNYNPDLFDTTLLRFRHLGVSVCTRLLRIYGSSPERYSVQIRHLIDVVIASGCWVEIATNIQELLPAISSLAEQNNFPTRILSIFRGSWRGPVIAIMLHLNGLLDTKRLDEELALACTSGTIADIPEILIPPLLGEISNLTLHNTSYISLRPLLRNTPSRSSAANIVKICSFIDLDKTLSRAPYTNVPHFTNLIMQLTSVPAHEYRSVYDHLLIRSVVEEGHHEHLLMAICMYSIDVENHRNYMEGLLKLAVPVTHFDTYKHMLKDLAVKSARSLVSQLSFHIAECIDRLAITRTLKFITYCIERWGVVDILSTTSRANILRHVRYMNPGLVREIVSMNPRIQIDQLHSDIPAWVLELCYSRLEHHAAPSNSYTDPNVEWSGLETTLVVTRRALDTVPVSSIMVVSNGSGLDYGGIRKEFFETLGLELWAIMDEVNRRLLPKAETAPDLLHDIGRILYRAYAVDRRPLGVTLHPLVHIACCWEWLFSTVSEQYPWIAVEHLLGQEWILELAPNFYYSVRDMPLIEKQYMSCIGFVEEITQRHEAYIPAVLAIRAGFMSMSCHRGALALQRCTPPQWFDAAIAGVGELHLDQLAALLQVTCPEDVSDIADLYSASLLEIIRDSSIERKRELYRFWFGTTHPNWSHDTPPKLLIIGAGASRGMFARTCFNQLEIPRMPSDRDFFELGAYLTELLNTSLLNYETTRRLGDLYQML
jgi:hypothetical protein